MVFITVFKRILIVKIVIKSLKIACYIPLMFFKNQWKQQYFGTSFLPLTYKCLEIVVITGLVGWQLKKVKSGPFIPFIVLYLYGMHFLNL